MNRFILDIFAVLSAFLVAFFAEYPIEEVYVLPCGYGGKRFAPIEGLEASHAR